jgi:hypothetical protein
LLDDLAALSDRISFTFTPQGCVFPALFNITSGNAGRRCDNTHMGFDRQSLTEDYMRPNAQTAQLTWPNVVD